MSTHVEYETMPGRSSQNARAALDKAVENGFAEEDVRTVREGYLIPINVEDEVEVAKPDKTWKNEDIVQYAGDHGIDLGEATKKDDMLAVIATAETKED